MDRFCLVSSRLFGCLMVALLVLGALVVPEEFTFADSGRGGTVTTPASASSCPNPITNGCFLNNGNPGACGGLGCTTRTDVCWCIYDPGTSKCLCPP